MEKVDRGLLACKCICSVFDFIFGEEWNCAWNGISYVGIEQNGCMVPMKEWLDSETWD